MLDIDTSLWKHICSLGYFAIFLRFNGTINDIVIGVEMVRKEE